jgi:two-component system response regulator BaeR
MTPGHLSGKILIVEDEPRLAQLVSDYLAAAGYLTCICSDGDAALQVLRQQKPDLVLLDWMLPGRDGLGICQEVRQFSNVPIIMVTAKIEEMDRLMGLDTGADDYICKPFSPREVVARVKALLRRVPPASSALADSADELVIDTARYQATLMGQALDLTPLEFRLLCTLAQAPGRVLSRSQLIDRLHEDQRAISDRAIDSHIKNLRRKLAPVTPGTELIGSIYGVGYKFEGAQVRCVTG